MRTLVASFLSLAVAASVVGGEQNTKMKRTNPTQLARPNGYSHVVEVGPRRTIYVSGQIALNQAGQLVGSGDIKAQTRQVFENLKVALASSGASLDDVVKITVFMTDISQLPGFREVRDTYFTSAPPASSLVEVKSLVRPDLLIEIEAVAVVEPDSAAAAGR